MTGAPVLSVVVPVRNDPDRLRACLTSLAASTLRDHELIVVDDASTDGSGEVARALGATVIRQERRTGPAAARNRGVATARGRYVLFVDADVCVHPETLDRVVAAFDQDPGADALFGSYDLTPRDPGFLSQYKNLFHHFVHQRASREASTFWAGCGAIRRSVFLEAGGFDTSYHRPSIEDIELGVRLVRSGRRIVLRGDVQVTHLKRWTLLGLLRSDVWDRGIPWTELILREGRLPNDLNLKTAERVGAALACAAALLVVTSLLGVPFPRLVSLAALLFVLTAFTVWNHDFYRFFALQRGTWFACRVVPLHVLYYLYSIAAFVIGAARHWSRPRPEVPNTRSGSGGEAPVSSFKAEEAAAYDGMADRFAELSERYSGDLAASLVGIASITAGDRVLDVGTGSGLVAVAAAGKVGTTGRVVGIDISAALLAIARRGAAARGLDDRVEYREMDAEALDLEDDSQDVVVSLFALLHLPDPLRALQQMGRVLRPGGRLVVAVGSGAPVSIAGLARRFRRLAMLWGVRSGSCLIAPDALESLLRSRLGPEEAAIPRWHEHARARRPTELGALAREAGFIQVLLSWEGRDLEVTTAEEFWDLQRTFSSVARRRIAAASPEEVGNLRREMLAQSEAVLGCGGRLIYPQGVLRLRALRPAP